MRPRYIALLLLLTTTIGSKSFSQGFAIPLRVSDNGAGTDTKWFGSATRLSLSCNFECPPKPPTGVFMVSLSSTNCHAWCADTIQTSFLNSSQIDTFQLEFQGGSGGFPISMTWGNVNPYYSGSVKLFDLFGGNIINVDMKMQNSATVSSLSGQLHIIAANPTPYTRQPMLKLPFIVSDSSNDSDTLWFGLDSSATACIDPVFGEYELPTDCGLGGPRVICSRFIDYPNNCLGEGTKINIRHYFSPSQIDTLRVDLYGKFPLTLRWSSMMNLYFESARIVDLFGGLILNIDMLTHDSLTISQHGLGQVKIITIGPKLLTHVSNDDNTTPHQLILYQNYPNPFNPTTTIRYDIPAVGNGNNNSYMATLKVFDILGREVATLVNESKSPGSYTVHWNATGMPSGVYYYRLSTGFFSKANKMLFLQ